MKLKDKVAIVTGGGSGHLPVFLGYVGKGLADGVAILLVTHDVELAAQIADRTVMMSQGEVIASGPTREVLDSTPNFSPQISRLLPGRGLLTAADALAYLMN